MNGGTLSNCVVSYNLSAYTWFAGGIHVQDVNVAYKCRIYDTLVVGNTNMGVCFSKGNSNPADSGPGPKQMVNCIVRDNTRHGLWLGGTNNWISNCVVSGNGGVGVYGYNGYLRNCLISGNASNGVLIHANCQTALVSACTIVDNLAANEGAGVRVEATAPGLVQFSSCIVAGNGASGTNDVYDASGNNAGALQYSCAGDLDGFSGVSNRVDDPQFKDAAGGDYRLRSSSPCINAGTNEPWMDTAADLAGGPRILHGTVDMGAYETLLIRGGIISIR